MYVIFVIQKDSNIDALNSQGKQRNLYKVVDQNTRELLAGLNSLILSLNLIRKGLLILFPFFSLRFMVAETAVSL